MRWDLSRLQEKSAWLGGNPAGSEGRTDPGTHPLHVPGALVALENLVWQSTSPVLQCTEASCSPVGAACSLGTPPACSKAGGTEVAVKKMGLGVPKQLFPLVFHPKVHFQPAPEGQNGHSLLLLWGQVSPPCPSPWPQHGAAHGCQGHCQNPDLGNHPSGVAGGLRYLLGAPRSGNPQILTQAQPFILTLPGWLLKHLDKDGCGAHPRWAPQSLSALSMQGSARLSRGSPSAIPQPSNLLYTEQGRGRAAPRLGCTQGGREGLREQSWEVSGTGTACHGVLGLQLLPLGARRLPAALAAVTAPPPPPRTSRETSPPFRWSPPSTIPGPLQSCCRSSPRPPPAATAPACPAPQSCTEPPPSL